MKVNRCINCMQNIEKDAQLCPCCGFRLEDYVQPPNALKVNTILCGKYLIGRVLGQGGFGITYVGYDLKLEMIVAVKEYFPTGSASRKSTDSDEISWSFTNTQRQDWQDGIGRFLTEARKMAKLDGVEGIVRVRDSFERNQTAYIVMDYAHGILLRQYFNQHGKQNPRQAVRLLLPIMESLETMHAKGLIHRDISPDNLMLQENGRETKIVLLDFGASMDMGHRASPKTEISVVKKGYSAPEQYTENGHMGSFTDVYAMAAVIYFCITGKEVPEAMERIIGTDTLSLDGIKNKKLRDVLARALAVKAEDRIQTMGEFSRALSVTVSDKGKIVKGGIAAACCAACAILAALYAARPWAPSAEVLGVSNSNIYQGANFNEIPGEYEYYADAEWNLHVCKYNEEDETFYLDTSEIVDHEAGFINIGKDKVYFVHDSEENPKEEDSIMQMDFDGSNVETVISAGFLYYVQYVQYADGREWIYYLKGEKEEEEDTNSFQTLCRYDLKKGTEEELLEEKIYWYNIDGKYIYYTSYEDSAGMVLKRAYLDGKRPETVNEKDRFGLGFIEDGTAYLFSWLSEQMLACELDGGEWENPFGEYSGQIFDGCSIYGDEWIYYSPTDSGEIHKIRTDGTGDTVIYTGENVLELNYMNEWLWVLTGELLEDGSYRYDHTFLMDNNGVQTAVMGSCVTADGLLYRQEAEGEVVLTGYLGDGDYVVVPWEFEEGRWNGEVSESFPKNVDIYTYAKKSELLYEKTEDGQGLVLNGYTGEKTGERNFLAFPQQIGGIPVVEVGKEFMKGNQTVEGIVFPYNLETIGENAFWGCTALKWVELPETLQTIEWKAFYHTGLKEVTLPAGLTNIYAGAFSEIRKMNVPKENPQFEVKDDVLYENGNVKLVFTSKKGDYVIPKDVELIASSAFTSSQLTSVTIPGSVKEIYADTFYKAKKLKKAVMEEGVEQIDAGAFYNCVSLSSVTIPKSVQTIDSGAFIGCSSLKKVTISRKCRIAEDAFEENVKIHYYD